VSTGCRACQLRAPATNVSRSSSAIEEKPMAFKPNYNHQRAERNRAKEQKKLEKRLRRDEEAARRKGGLDEPQQELETGETAPDNPSEDADGPQKTTR
jgi:hypothetical protein